MSVSSSEHRPFTKYPKKNGKSEQHKTLGHRKKESEVYVGNLPLDTKEEEILSLLKDFGPLRVQKVQNGCKCFAFVDLASAENVHLAVKQLNGQMFHNRKLYLNSNNWIPKQSLDSVKSNPELPALENVPFEDKAVVIPGELEEVTSPMPATQTPRAPVSPNVTERPRTASYAVPMEMRGSFLVFLLRDCFQDLSWLAIIRSIRGDVGLLVTDTIPQTPFFWAIHLTEEAHLNMEKLFYALAEVEEQQPYLAEAEVQRGIRCLGECHLGDDDGGAWNRCWVLDRIGDWAVVLFIDFGCSATLPVQSLRSLDSDDFWAIPPLTQPFMLEKAPVWHLGWSKHLVCIKLKQEGMNLGVGSRHNLNPKSCRDVVMLRVNMETALQGCGTLHLHLHLLIGAPQQLVT
ncbi:tudor domain-containing protein 10 isoform X1 [Macrotis lagotis]|uniref:tudor domain-containing protein 10 isoform X1 n=1 Tax=Macrotis lagotis TaxID=92651 RepID=UPI003D698F19